MRRKIEIDSTKGYEQCQERIKGRKGSLKRFIPAKLKSFGNLKFKSQFGAAPKSNDRMREGEPELGS